MKNSLENIEKLLIFLVFLSFPLMDARVSVSGIPFYLPEIFVFSAFVVHGVRFFRRSLSEGTIPTGVIVASALIFLGVTSSMAVNGADRDALGAIKSWFLFPALFAWLIFRNGFSEKNAWRSLACWFFSIAVVSFATLTIPSLSVETYDGRLRSVFPSPNHFGFFLEYGAIIGFGLMIFLRDRKNPVLILVLSEAAIIAALFLTRSDGALISATFGAAILFVSAMLPTGTAKKVLSLACIFAAFFLALAFLSLDRDVLGSGMIRDSFASRVMIWNASSRMIAEHPFFGIGPRNFQEAYLVLQPEFPPYLEWAVPHPHNIFLSFWLFTGVVGLFGFVLLLFILFRRVFPDTDDIAPILSGTLFGLLTAFCMHGLVDTPYFRNDLSYAFWVTAAFILLRRNKKDAEAPKL